MDVRPNGGNWHVDVRLEDNATDVAASLERGGDAAGPAMDRAVSRIADDVLGATRRKVPRGPSGAARASLQVMGSSGTETLSAGGRKAPYFGWLDFGGHTGARGGRGRRPYKRAGRYIYPALASLDNAITRHLTVAADETVRASG